jgi:hypothetical protein
MNKPTLTPSHQIAEWAVNHAKSVIALRNCAKTDPSPASRTLYAQLVRKHENLIVKHANELIRRG